MVKKKFRASQAAHMRWYKHHKKAKRTDSGRYDVHFVRENYHYGCFNRQKKLGRALTKKEKKNIYDDIILTFY